MIPAINNTSPNPSKKYSSLLQFSAAFKQTYILRNRWDGEGNKTFFSSRCRRSFAWFSSRPVVALECNRCSASSTEILCHFSSAISWTWSFVSSTPWATVSVTLMLNVRYAMIRISVLRFGEWYQLATCALTQLSLLLPPLQFSWSLHLLQQHSCWNAFVERTSSTLPAEVYLHISQFHFSRTNWCWK